MCCRVVMYRNDLLYSSEWGSINAAINYIARKVSESVEEAYNVDALDTSKPKLRQWVDTANECNDDYIPPMIYAHYGYAVEELTNEKLQVYTTQPLNGYRLTLQKDYNVTRPDITLSKGNNSDFAWLDITSNDGHIKYKSGECWRSKPVVAELVYPHFSLENIRRGGGSSIASRAPFNTLSRHNSMHNNAVMCYFEETFSKVLRNHRNAYINSQKSKNAMLSLTEKFFQLNMFFSNKQQVINSMLKLYLEVSYNQVLKQTANDIQQYHYKGKKLNKSCAMSYIGQAYYYYQKINRIYYE